MKTEETKNKIKYSDNIATDKEKEIDFVLAEVIKCNHTFKRIRPNQIECSKCGFGFFDNPDDPFKLST